MEERMEEKRSIEVTLEQAIEWYNGSNATLKTLALTAYTEDELIPDFNYIKSKVDIKNFNAIVPVNEETKYGTLTVLAIIAKYFNGIWVKTIYNAGYYIGNYNVSRNPVANAGNGIGVYKDNFMKYAGTVYFRNQEDAIKAIKILGDKVKYLF